VKVEISSRDIFISMSIKELRCGVSRHEFPGTCIGPGKISVPLL
jgi:hypothetical protein